MLIITPLYADGFSHTYCYNKYGNAHFVLIGVTDRSFKTMISVSEVVFLILANSAGPHKMQHYAA